MKTSNKILSAVLLTAVLTAGGCKDAELILAPETPTFVVIDGDTVKTRKEKDFDKIKDKDPNKKNYIVVGDTVVLYKKPKLHTPPAKDPDLSKLKNNDDPDLKGKPLRMIAIGGSLTAGVRDGGYFNEGIETSYPNLIARQMKLKKFEQPLFDAADYNGFGRKVRTNFNPTGGPVPKFNAVENNSGVEYANEKEVKLKKYKEKEGLDNFSYPSLTSSSVSMTASELSIDGKRIEPNYQQGTVITKIFDKKFDFFLFEVGLGDFFKHIVNMEYGSGGLSGIGSAYPTPDKIFKERRPDDLYNSYINGQTRFFWNLKDNNVKKGCILNLPNILDFPYLKNITKEQVNNKVKQFVPNAGSDLLFLKDEIIIPTSEIDSLLSDKVHPNLKKGLSLKNKLSERSYLSRNYVTSLTTAYNLQSENFSKYLNIPIADIYSLYQKIIKGGYVTDDGVSVDASYPNGNFFSSDGIYPTAFGQAIIANEVIKTLNSFYKTEIPLIPTREYLEVK